MTKYEVYETYEDLKARKNPRIVVVGRYIETYLMNYPNTFEGLGIILIESDNEILKRFCEKK